MKLNILGDPENSVPQNEVDKDAMGGTELMKHALFDKIDKNLLDKFNIIPSRSVSYTHLRAHETH